MFSVKTMTPLKSSKQTSAAASKIKNKILNTSSFFKVSLKTNNKALALALEAQKELSRQREMEVVYLQKQVEALCFELATRKYKHRKMLLILENLRASTLQHFDMVAELLSDSDSPEPSEGCGTLPGVINKESPAAGSLSDPLPVQPEGSGNLLLCPSKNLTENLSGKDPDNTDAGKRRSSQWTGPSPRSSSLRAEVERLSMMFSQSGFDVKSVVGLQIPRTCEEPTPSPPRGSAVEPEPPHGNKQEVTVLLNTTMEMTQSDAAKIVTVETKAKNTQRSGKPKGKKKPGPTCGSGEDVQDSANSRASEEPTGTLLRTDARTLEDVGHPQVLDLQSPRTQCKSVMTSRIPKRAKAQKPSKNKSKSCDVVQPDLDDYFTDPNIYISKVSGSGSEHDAAEETGSRVTVRKTRTRTRSRKLSSASRKTSGALKPQDGESCQSEVEQVPTEVEQVPTEVEQVPTEVEQVPTEVEAETKDQQMSAEFCRDEELLSPSGNKLQSKTTTVSNTRSDHRPRCRGTFIVSVDRDSASSHRPSPEHGVVPPTGSTCEAQEEKLVGRHSESNSRSSWKRPREVTQEDDHHEELDRLAASASDGQRHKKARREETGRSNGKKGGRRAECEELLNDKQKKKVRPRNKEFRADLSVAAPLCGSDRPTTTEQRSEGSPALDSQCDSGVYDSKSRRSKPRRDLCRKTFTLHTAAETPSPRETFVIYHKPRDHGDAISVVTTRTVVDVCDQSLHQNVEDLLMDELPPWLAMDVSAADTEPRSRPASPSRRTCGREEVVEEPAAVSAEASAAPHPGGAGGAGGGGGVLTPLAHGGRTRRRNCAVTYKEPALNRKMRRGDDHSDCSFLSSPVFKDGRRRRKKTKTRSREQTEAPVILLLD